MKQKEKNPPPLDLLVSFEELSKDNEMKGFYLWMR